MDDLNAATFALSEALRPELTKIHEFLAEHAPGQLHLVIGEDASIVAPDGLEAAIRMVVEALSRGQAVSVVPQSHVLTTQQAADLLGVSRPTLIRLLEANRLPYQQVNSHRRLLLDDVLRYREERRQAQYQFLADTAVDPGEEDDVDAVLERLRRIRQRAKS